MRILLVALLIILCVTTNMFFNSTSKIAGLTITLKKAKDIIYKTIRLPCVAQKNFSENLHTQFRDPTVTLKRSKYIIYKSKSSTMYCKKIFSAILHSKLRDLTVTLERSKDIIFQSTSNFGARCWTKGLLCKSAFKITIHYCYFCYTTLLLLSNGQYI